MAEFYVTGGRQRRGAKGEEEWFSYEEALIVKVDTEAKCVDLVASYRSPAAHCPTEPKCNMVFKAGSIDGEVMHVCTQTEIITYQLPTFERLNCLTHKWFNDLHHVVVGKNGHFLVAVTGLDMVLEISKTGEVVREIPVLAEDIWQRFDREIDYRRVLTTTPHRSHPNFVYEYGGDVFVTRFVQRDSVCLTGRSFEISPKIEKLHDGIIFGHNVYFTAVDGHIVKADLSGDCEIETSDLNAMTDTNKTLGWCRGLHLLDADRVIVGFSRIRPSKIRENVRWVKHHMGLREYAGKLGTRISCYNLVTCEHEWDIDLEKHGMNAVFSILPA